MALRTKNGPVIKKRFRLTREALRTLGPLTAAELTTINGMEDYSPTTMAAWLGTSEVQAALGLTRKRKGREFVYSIAPPHIGDTGQVGSHRLLQRAQGLAALDRPSNQRKEEPHRPSSLAELRSLSRAQPKPEPAVKNAVLYPVPNPWTVPLAITIAVISAVGLITVSILTLAIINVLSYLG